MKYHKLCIAFMLFSSTLVECKGAKSQKQQEIWRLECALGVLSDPACPVDGGWSAWGEWGKCRGACGAGSTRRARRCDNPPPANDGLDCDGPDQQLEACYIQNCTANDYRDIIKGDVARMESMRLLEAVPALLERCLQTDCPYEGIEGALSIDNTWGLEPESLWNAMLCVKHNTGCPVMGAWSGWGPWSSCGARCGEGARWRERRCDSPPPSAAYLRCRGDPLQADRCEGDQCALELFVFRRDRSIGAWSAWSPWTSCSETCGPGVRRRRRTCHETKHRQVDETWGTHCRGQHDEKQACQSKTCTLQGGWSGWGAWGPCSRLCGAGRRARSRSCTRPAAAGPGAPCHGARSEYGVCHLKPCEVFQHTTVLLNGDSYLHYSFENKRTTLFHFYVRFRPQSPHGTLVRRGATRDPYVRVSLQNWHVCVDSCGRIASCSLPRLCTPFPLESATWHTALVVVTTESAEIRVDDVQSSSKETFPCDPEFPDDVINVWVGEKFHGEIQEVIMNFLPLKFSSVTKRTFGHLRPHNAANIAFTTSSLDEAYLPLNNENFIRVPCFPHQTKWQLDLTVMPKKESGTLLFLEDKKHGHWLEMSLRDKRLRLRLGRNEDRAESLSAGELLPYVWLDVTLRKDKGTDTIEALVNGAERMHVVLSNTASNINDDFFHSTKANKSGHTTYKKKKVKTSQLSLCQDEFYIGGGPREVAQVYEELTPFYGVIAALKVDDVLKDLYELSVERVKDGHVQVSSRTASVSGAYHETVWGRSNELNLTCLHARTLKSTYRAQWLYLDVAIKNDIRNKVVHCSDDGRVLRLYASANNNLRGFYTCRAFSNRRTRNLITYGVLGEMKSSLSTPDTTTAVAVLTTLALVIVTVSWLVAEVIRDLRNGFGFFRDRNLSPQEEVEAICKYIDQNLHMYESKAAAKMAKARARRRGQAMISRMSFGAQEPEGMAKEQRLSEFLESSSSDGFSPAVKTGKAAEQTQVFRCEQSFVSSPRHGSVMSRRSKVTPSSGDSPRLICSKLLLMKRPPSRDSFISRRFRNSTKEINEVISPNSPKFKSLSPALKVLLRFRQLKNDI